MAKKNTEVTAVEAAQMLGVGLDYLYGLLWTRKLSGRKVSGRWRVALTAIEERIAAQRVRNG